MTFSIKNENVTPFRSDSGSPRAAWVIPGAFSLKQLIHIILSAGTNEEEIMPSSTLSNIEFINACFAPCLDEIERQYLPIQKEVGIRFSSLTLGRYKSGKKLSSFEIQRLASFAEFYSLESEGKRLLEICEVGVALSEARLGIQLRLLQNKAVKTGRTVNYYVHLPDDISLYVYVDPEGAWFSNVNERDFTEHRFGLTNKTLKHIKYCARNMLSRGEQHFTGKQEFRLRFHKR